MVKLYDEVQVKTKEYENKGIKFAEVKGEILPMAAEILALVEFSQGFDLNLRLEERIEKEDYYSCTGIKRAKEFIDGIVVYPAEKSTKRKGQILALHY